MCLLVLRRQLGTCADWFAVAIAIALPWSTTAIAVFVVLWFFALLGSWNIGERVHERWMLAGLLPVAVWVVGLLGLLWASVPLAERLAGLNSFHKLLAIPFLAVQFRDSHRGLWVLIGFLVSCTVLLVLSWGLILLPHLLWRGRERTGGDGIMVGIPVKDYISQGTMFTLCIIGLAHGALSAWDRGNVRIAIALVLLAITFFLNLLYADVSRTTLVALPVLLMLFAFMRLGWKGATAFLLATAMLLALAWSTSPRLRDRVTSFFNEVSSYDSASMSTSAGERLEYWRKSVRIVAQAPIVGQGTGSIHEQFSQLAAGHVGMSGLAAANPHNQVFAIAIQLGLIGVSMLVAMWIVHLGFFVGPTLAAGIGLAVVVQNIISSQFNSSLFDFTHGWVYVLGVGVLGGMLLREVRSREGCDQLKTAQMSCRTGPVSKLDKAG
jgi:O-antigen ligase